MDDVDELAAPLGRPGRNAGVVAGEIAAAAPTAGVAAAASSRPGTGTARPPTSEPDAQPPGRGHGRASRRVDVPDRPALARANPAATLALRISTVSAKLRWLLAHPRHHHASR